MELDPNIPPRENRPDAGSATPLLPAKEPPVIGAPSGLSMVPDPPIPADPNRGSLALRKFIAVLLSFCLALFLVDSLVSLADSTLSLFFNIQSLAPIRGLVFFFDFLLAIVVYVLMALTPMVPKRWFLPLTLFNPAIALLLIPVSIYCYDKTPQIVWGASIFQVIVGVGILCWVMGGLKLRWPLVEESQLGLRSFSLLNLLIFIGANVLLIPPAVVVYLVICAALAVNHYTEGFMSLRPVGLTVQVRKYVRDDGQTIELFPMSHIADSDFYQKVSESFPTNSVILMEGVTDEKNLLTNKISYKRVAAKLGLAEQHEKFVPTRGQLVRADVDVDEFAPSTIGLLNMAMLIHTKGLNAGTLMELLQFPQPPHFETQLFDDLVKKRNQHLLGEIQNSFAQSKNVMVPWGALHMPGISRGIQKEGFHQVDSQEYVVVRFGPGGHQETDEKPK